VPDDASQPDRTLDELGQTALAIAYMRARESARPDPLFDDPLAQAFLDAVPGATPATPEDGSDPVAALAPVIQALMFGALIRTRFFDDYLVAATSAGSRQVVLLAAGLDARAFRLDWPAGTRVFEVDRAPVLAFKDQVLAGQQARPLCERVAVSADLTGDWPAALTGAGFDPGTPTTWLTEGVLSYLTAEQATALLTAIGEQSAPGSRLAFEHYRLRPGSVLDRAGALPEMAMYAGLWKGGLGNDTPDWLQRHGWRVAVEAVSALAASYGRPDPGAEGSLVAAVRV
jgi:methyltransferase (TIGR00027 family)